MGVTAEHDLRAEYEAMWSSFAQHSPRALKRLRRRARQAGLTCWERLLDAHISLLGRCEPEEPLWQQISLGPAVPGELRNWAMLLTAFYCERKADFPRAIDCCSNVVAAADATGVQQVAALGMRADYLHRLDKAEELAADLAVIAGHPCASVQRATNAMMNQAALLAVGETIDEALAAYAAISERYPDLPEVKSEIHCNRGKLYARRGEWAKVVEEMTQALTERAASGEVRAEALFNRGRALGELGDHRQAIRDLSAFLKHRSAALVLQSRALLYRGQSYQCVDRLRRAIADATAAMNHPEADQKTRDEARIDRGIARARAGRFREALQDFDEAIRDLVLRGRRADGLHGLRGLALQGWGKLQDSLAEFSQIVDRSGSSARLRATACCDRAAVYQLMGEAELARADWLAVLDNPAASEGAKEEAGKALGALRLQNDVEGR